MQKKELQDLLIRRADRFGKGLWNESKNRKYRCNRDGRAGYDIAGFSRRGYRA